MDIDEDNEYDDGKDIDMGDAYHGDDGNSDLIHFENLWNILWYWCLVHYLISFLSSFRLIYLRSCRWYFLSFYHNVSRINH